MKMVQELVLMLDATLRSHASAQKVETVNLKLCGAARLEYKMKSLGWRS